MGLSILLETIFSRVSYNLKDCNLTVIIYYVEYNKESMNMSFTKCVNVLTFTISFIIITYHNSDVNGMYDLCIYYRLEYYIKF